MNKDEAKMWKLALGELLDINNEKAEQTYGKVCQSSDLFQTSPSSSSTVSGLDIIDGVCKMAKNYL